MDAPVKYTFNGDEARGEITVSRSPYGLAFDVMLPNGRKIEGLLDLFYFSPEMEESEEKNIFKVHLTTTGVVKWEETENNAHLTVRQDGTYYFEEDN